jgi:hypothetical protein
VRTNLCGEGLLRSVIPICPATQRNPHCSAIASLGDNSIRQLKKAGCAHAAAGDEHAFLEHREQGSAKKMARGRIRSI